MYCVIFIYLKTLVEGVFFSDLMLIFIYVYVIFFVTLQLAQALKIFWVRLPRSSNTGPPPLPPVPVRIDDS
jgi:hypothetical protein